MCIILIDTMMGIGGHTDRNTSISPVRDSGLTSQCGFDFDCIGYIKYHILAVLRLLITAIRAG